MRAGASKASTLAFAVGASLTGGLIGAWEAALLVIFDPELTTSRGGAVEVILVGAGVGALLALVAAAAFALIRRLRPGRAVFGTRTSGVTFALAVAALFYGGYYLNEAVLPGKLHPLSLGVDLLLLALCWLAIRFLPPVRLGRTVRSVLGAVVFFGALTSAALVAGSSVRLGPPDAPPPKDAANLLLITMDTTRADRLGAYGGPPGLTPNLDALAASGYVFERAHCAMPLTGPSHAALLTGRTPREGGVVQNGVSLETDSPTIAEVLRSRGYRTGAVVAAFTVSSKLGFARGFELFDDDFGTANALTRLTLLRLAGSLGLIDAKARLQRPGNEVTPVALRWLREESDRPFFLWVHYFDPHTPYAPPPEYLHLTQARDPHAQAYDGEVAFMDAEIGKLLAALDKAGVRDNTVIVAVADHGESLGEHDYYYDHGRYVYEPCMHVPLVVAAPAGFGGLGGLIFKRETRPLTLTSLYDFLLDGLAAYPSSPEAAAEVTPPGGDVIFGESLEGDLNYRMVMARVDDAGPWYKLVLDAKSGAVELYDLDADPAETQNLSRERLEVTRILLKRLEEHFASQPPLPTGAPADAEMMKKLQTLGYI